MDNTGINIHVNADKSLVIRLREAIKENGGHCISKKEHSRETKCICKEFQDQIEDDEFSGPCRCGLYIKEFIE